MSSVNSDINASSIYTYNLGINDLNYNVPITSNSITIEGFLSLTPTIWLEFSVFISRS